MSCESRIRITKHRLFDKCKWSLKRLAIALSRVHLSYLGNDTGGVWVTICQFCICSYFNTSIWSSVDDSDTHRLPCPDMHVCRTVARYGTSATFVFKVAHALCYILHEGASQMFDQANNASHCLGNGVPLSPPRNPLPSMNKA